MGKYTTEQLEQELFALMCETTTQITSNKEIFPNGFTYDDFERVFIYAYSVAFAHNEILNNKLEKGFFSSCLASFYKMARESYNYSLEETREKMANGIKYFEPFHAAHINYMMHAKDEDALVNYVSAILSNIPSTKDKSAFSTTGIALVSILPDILNRIFVVCEKIVSLNNENKITSGPEEKTVNNLNEKSVKKANKKPILLILIIALVCSLIGNGFLYSENLKLQENVFTELEQKEYEYYHKNVVIVNSSTNRYHKYGCKEMETGGFTIYYYTRAKSAGYSPCSYCNPDSIRE